MKLGISAKYLVPVAYTALLSVFRSSWSTTSQPFCFCLAGTGLQERRAATKHALESSPSVMFIILLTSDLRVAATIAVGYKALVYHDGSEFTQPYGRHYAFEEHVRDWTSGLRFYVQQCKDFYISLRSKDYLQLGTWSKLRHDALPVRTKAYYTRSIANHACTRRGKYVSTRNTEDKTNHTRWMTNNKTYGSNKGISASVATLSFNVDLERSPRRSTSRYEDG